MKNRAVFYHQPKTVAPETTDTPVVAPSLPGKTGDLLPFFLNSQGARPECKACGTHFGRVLSGRLSRGRATYEAPSPQDFKGFYKAERNKKAAN